MLKIIIISIYHNHIDTCLMTFVATCYLALHGEKLKPIEAAKTLTGQT